MQPHEAFVARLQSGLLGAPAGGTTDMEGAHRKLRARLANRLRGHDADGLAHVDLMTAAKVAAVTLHAYALARLAGQHRTDFDLFESRFLDSRDQILIDHVVRANQHFVGKRVADVLQRDASEYAIAETFDNFAAFDQRRHLDSVERAAIAFGDNRILRHIDQPPRQIA